MAEGCHGFAKSFTLTVRRGRGGMECWKRSELAVGCLTIPVMIYLLISGCHVVTILAPRSQSLGTLIVCGHDTRYDSLSISLFYTGQRVMPTVKITIKSLT